MNFFPSMKRRAVPGARGEQLTSAPDDRWAGDDGKSATVANVDVASRHWPKGRLEDFERVGRRKWLHTTTGKTDREVEGVGPLMSPSTDANDLYLLAGGQIVLLISDSRATHSQTYVGEIVSRNLGPAA